MRQSVSVGPYCTLDGDVRSSNGIRGHRQHTAQQLHI